MVFEDDAREYCVLVNDERQYSLWPASRQPPTGWHAVGPKGTRHDCLSWIGVNWIDMRPRSLADITG